MKWKIPAVSAQTALLFFFAIAFLLQSMAIYHKEHYPLIIVHNPATNIAELAHASRKEEALQSLMSSGFVQAACMVTASHPYEFPEPQIAALNEAYLNQFFSPAVGNYVQESRRKLGFYQTLGTIRLNPDYGKLKIRPAQGSLYFEGFFTREFPTGNNERRFTQFQIKALGNLAPVTRDNPFGVKFTQFSVLEIDPKSIRSQQ